MKQIPKGFSENVAPDTKPAVCVFGDDNTGTTRFACTAPDPIGWLSIDRNSKITLAEQQIKRGFKVIANSQPVVEKSEAMKMAMNDSKEKSIETYTAVVKRAFEMVLDLAAHADVASIAIDRMSQLHDYVLFSYFGRKTQIEPYERGKADQDMIDLINALGDKNLVLVCKANEIWKSTGDKDKNNKPIQAPTGKYKPDGFGKIGRFVTATVELTANRKKSLLTEKDFEDDDELLAEKLKEKYRARIVTCKGNVLLEGSDLNDYGIAGEDITWDNLITLIGVNS